MPTTDPSPSHATVETPSLAALIEAALLSIDRPLPASRLAEAFETAGLAPISKAEIDQAIELLNAEYAEAGRAIRIEQTADGYRVMTRAEVAPLIAAIAGGKPSTKLSKAALETLAIVAYKQPITRARLEAIRGVACGEVLRALIDRKLITIAGRAEEIGRPMLYGTTRDFLRVFGLAGVRDLPPLDAAPGEGTEPASDSDV
ncbi:MAG: SMC-Scp complex subunit ScpB [Planctomycetota bacterium]